jgi:hypothetical protein
MLRIGCWSCAGRIGWVAKGIVYGLIGGLCCRGAISEDLNIDASPQVRRHSSGFMAAVLEHLCRSLCHRRMQHTCCLEAKTSHALSPCCPVAQGAFVLIGKGAAGIYILIVMAVALATYIIWRFWEGITAQVPLSRWTVTCRRLANRAPWLCCL